MREARDIVIWRGRAFARESTGGGCEAYEHDGGPGEYWLITDDLCLPELGGPAEVARFESRERSIEAEPIETWDVLVWIPDDASEDERLTAASQMLRGVADSMEARGDGYSEADIRALATDVWLRTEDGHAEVAADG